MISSEHSGSVHQHPPTLPEDKKWSLFGMIFGTAEHVQVAQTRPNNIVCALVSLSFAKVIAFGKRHSEVFLFFI